MRARSRSGSLRWLLPVLLLASGAYPGSAVAAAAKPYTLNLSPATVPAGTQAAFSATFANPPDGQQQLGSANLTVPAGIALRSASVPAPATVTVVGSTVRLRNLALAPGRSLTVTVVADVACNPAIVTWAVQAKQANDFQGPPGNDLTLAAPSSLTTTISGQCKLRFVTQPSNQRVGEPLTGTPYGPGPPVSAEILDAAGARVTNQSADVTIARGAGSGFGSLSGVKTVGTVLGVASFPDLALSAPGTYSLQASSAGLVSESSTTFRVDTVAAFCADDVSCARSTSLGSTKLDVTAQPAGASADAGFLTLSFNAGPRIDCAGYEEISPDTALVDFSSPNRTKEATLTFDKKVMTQSPNNGAAFLELCFGSPQPFLTKAGGVSVPLGSFDWDSNGTADPVYAGLLPDCGAHAPPCVASRNKVGAGDGVIGALMPAGLGDPAMRG